MKSIGVIIFLLTVFLQNISSQEENEIFLTRHEIGSCNFIGYYYDQIVYIQEETWNTYLVNESDKIGENVMFKLHQKGNKTYIGNSRQKIRYINDDFSVYSRLTRSNNKPFTYKYELVIKSNEYNISVPLDYQIQDFVVNENKDLIIFTGEVDTDCIGCQEGDLIAPNLMQLDLTNPDPKLERIRELKGRYPTIRGDYLYFYDYHEKRAYDEKYNIYRTKIREWDDVQMIFRETYCKCYIFPNNELLFAKLFEEKNTKYVLYNIETKSFEYLENLDLYKPSFVLEKYESTGGASHFSYKHNTPVLTGVKYHYITNIPKEFPYKYREIRDVDKNGKNRTIYKGYESFDDLPKKVDLSLSIDEKERLYNFPRSAKPFTGTFITDELMYDASKDELNELTKEEFRLLRNAFFARLGYKFKSEDLQNFFGQFDWYQNSMDRQKLSNEDIIIPDADKERIDLILEIENSK